jgi:hypothetical protein
MLLTESELRVIASDSEAIHCARNPLWIALPLLRVEDARERAFASQ